MLTFVCHFDTNRKKDIKEKSAVSQNDTHLNTEKEGENLINVISSASFNFI